MSSNEGATHATERERWRNGPVDDGKWPVEAEVEDEDGPENIEDDKYAPGLGVAKGALSVAKKTERDVAAATEAGATEREDTADTEAADSTTTSTGVGAARMDDGEETNEWSTGNGGADSNDGPARRVVIDYGAVATVDGDKVCGGPRADELRRKMDTTSSRHSPAHRARL
ncbi:hypothetical protein PF002_g5013 [Phytophthora fragariae]|uniref:Uncharacterized protein n=1 Tax=Phytophthora fragariae TaxID=53985 RepID=A0A6A4A432_9STRA|nr:hypothetical protein PF002_g5013 [Phytophthora fragariae]